MILQLAKKMAIKLNKKNPLIKDLYTKKYKPKVVKPKKGRGSFKRNKKQYMDVIFLLKVLFFLALMISLYAVLRNLNIIKIILVYWKDLILRK